MVDLLTKTCLGLLAVALAVGRPVAEAPAEDVDRSPVDLVLAPDNRWLATANQTSDSVSLLRIGNGALLDEIPIGTHPTAISLAPDSNTLLVTCRDSGELNVLRVAGDKLLKAGSIHVGFHPHGAAVAADGKTAYVALTAADQIAVVDLEQRQLLERIDVGRWPRYPALSPDGSRLAVGTSGDRGVSVVDTRAGKMAFQQRFVGLNVGHLAASRDGEHVYFPWMIYRANPISAGNIRLGWVLASRLARLRWDGSSRREAISLDPPGRAVADPFGIALASDDAWIVASAAGTHELLIFRADGLPFLERGGTDHIVPELLEDKQRFDRIELGGRPMGLRIGNDDRLAYVANYLENAVQVVDIRERRLVRTLPLGGPAEPSLARRGAAIFYDARRSLDQWYSCQSCHLDGGANAVPMDTLNDDTRFSFKTVLPLYDVEKTPPWTWHGWQTDLEAAMEKSITSTMLGPPPSGDDVTALIAYLRTLDRPPNPFREPDGSLSASAQRGKLVFHSERAGCASCHSGEHFTDGEVHDVGLGKSGDRYRGFNTPTLLGVYQKTRLLHDGRASSLREVLTGDHAPEQVNGEELSEEELADLIAYLKSL